MLPCSTVLGRAGHIALHLALSLVAVCAFVVPASGGEGTVAGLEEGVPRLMELGAVPGISAAFIEDGRIVWTGAFGVRNTETGEPIDDETVFEAASMTKPVCAYVAMRMIDRGELSLDTPLFTYLRETRFPETERYERLTAEHVLTHTSGLPNWGVDFEADPGEQFGYSGEGFAYLGRVMAAISGLPLDELVRREVFEPLDMHHSSMVWNEQCAANGTTGHDRHAIPNGQRASTEPNAGGSMLTTASDYAAVMLAIMNEVGLEEETVADMLEPHVSAREWDSDELDEHVWWGLGWGLQPTESGYAFWHWGNNVDVRGYATADPAVKRGFVYFANGENGHTISEELLALALPDRQWALDWLGITHYDDPDRSLLLDVEGAYLDGGTAEGRGRLEAARADFPEIADESFMEEIARYLSSRELDEETLDILDVWVTAFPDSAEGYASRGSHHFEMERFGEALADFRTAADLAPARDDVRGMERWVDELVASIEDPMCMPDDVLEWLAGDYGPRHVLLRDNRLYYQRDGRDEYLLSAMGESTFRLEGINYFRMRFVADDESPATKLIGIYMDGRQDESLRDPPAGGE